MQIFKRTPLVQGIDALDQVYKLSRFLGTEEMMAFSLAKADDLKEAQQLRDEMRTALENPGTKKFSRSDMSEFLTK